MRSRCLLGLFGVWILALYGADAGAAAAGPKHPAPAQTTGPADIPDALRPWIPWVLAGQDQLLCPFVYTDAQQRRCTFGSRLALNVANAGGDFRFEVEASRRDSLVLPGDAVHWPLEVRLDGQPAVVVQQGDLARVAVGPGRHVLSGRFLWQSLPEALQLPRQTALLDLRLNGAPVAGAVAEADGRVWLRKGEAPADEAGNVEVRVHRLVVDDIPLILRTHIALDVSGKNREVVIGPVLSGDFTPMHLESPLPARLSEDGLLHVQAGPGEWNLYLDARHTGPAAQLARPKAPHPWPEQEVWAVELHPELRQATVEGVPGIDAAQTGLPEDWRKDPAYRVLAGDHLALKEQSRGDDQAAADQLSLARTWWLDFDGGGYTLQDAIRGTVKRSWRLDMSPPVTLGRIAVDGRDQFLTKLTDTGPAGVELRRGRLELRADSRYEGAGRSLPAVGWDEDFQHVSGALELPPGWRLFAATGVDKASGTWVETWTLMDFFLLLIVSLATYRLTGPRWGALAFVTLVVTITEDGAPRYLWLAALLALALLRVLKTGRATRLVRLYQLGVAAAFAVVVLPFMARQIHVAIHACLERPGQAVGNAALTEQRAAEGDGNGGGGDHAPAEEPVSAASVADNKAADDVGAAAPSPGAKDEERGGSFGASVAKSRRVQPRSYAAPAGGKASRQTLNDYDPKAKVQTGPGLPTWRWRSSSLVWNGPVDRHQELRFWLMPPWLNTLLGLARCLLLVVLVAVALGRAPGGGGGGGARLRRRRRDSAAAAVLAAAALWGPRAAAAELPGKELLDELKARVAKTPDCLPQCAVSPRMSVEYDAATLRLRLEIDAAADVVVPLPGKAKEWAPDPVLVDGVAAPSLYRDDDGLLWVRLAPGVHQLVLAGPLPRREAVQLALPLKPHHVSAGGGGWTLSGLHEDGAADDNLELKRVHSGTDARAAPLAATSLPPFVRVERELVIDLSWQAHTRVVRVTSADTAIVLRVPLLPGESVTSADVRTEGGAVLVNIPPGATEAGWSSVLAPTGALTLVAPDNPAWMETWRLRVSPIWHFGASGVPALADVPGADQRVPTWRPWPGETLALTLSKPGGVDGQSLTLDGSTLTVRPGLRATDVTLALSVRSSRGGLHTLTLPKGADLQAYSVDGKEQSLRHDGDKLSVPLVPGAEQVSVTWRQDGGVRPWLRTEAADLGQGSVNANVQIEMPADRWVLWTSGPRMGPAVLYWGLLVFLLLVAAALGTIPLTPLRTLDWFLLGLGLSQTSVTHGLLIGALFFGLGWRRRAPPPANPWVFNVLQLALVVLAAASAVALVDVIQAGFLGYPDMQIRGNASTNQLLRWYQDRLTGPLPVATVVSVPMLFYRLAMLAWALWLALFLLRRVGWLWDSFGRNGLWVRPRRRRPSPAAAEASPFAAPPGGDPPPARGP